MHENTRLTGRRLPARLVADSDPLGWEDVLCRTYREDPVAEGFDSLATPDVGVIVVTSGTYRVETTRDDRWVSGLFHPGSVALVLPHEAGSVRWRSVGPDPLESIHVHVAAEVVKAALGPAGRAALARPVEGLDQRTPYLAHAVTALGDAVRLRAPSLLAASLAHGIVAQMVLASGSPRDPAPGRGLDPRALADVEEYLHANLSADIRLEDLATVAFLSKWHFLRQFTRSTGRTPHAYLRELRIERAKELLGRGATLESAARGSGLGSATQLGRVFRRELGVTPGSYRRAVSGRPAG